MLLIKKSVDSKYLKTQIIYININQSIQSCSLGFQTISLLKTGLPDFPKLIFLFSLTGCCWSR